MYINDLGIKEINQYYAQHGGKRTNNIKNFANYIENAKTSRISAAKAQIAAQANTAAGAAIGTTAGNGQTSPASQRAASNGQTDHASQRVASNGQTDRTSQRAASNGQVGSKQTDSNSADTSGSKNACCDNCRLTSQLMLQMMSNNLYTQGALGYSGTGAGILGYTGIGSGALAAYQSLSKYFGTGVFS